MFVQVVPKWFKLCQDYFCCIKSHLRTVLLVIFAPDSSANADYTKRKWSRYFFMLLAVGLRLPVKKNKEEYAPLGCISCRYEYAPSKHLHFIPP